MFRIGTRIKVKEMWDAEQVHELGGRIRVGDEGTIIEYDPHKWGKNATSTDSFLVQFDLDNFTCYMCRGEIERAKNV